jgi:long-chain acyl-CoA synthetase
MFLQSALWIGFAVVIPSMVLYASSKKRAVIVGTEEDLGSRPRRSPEGAAQLVDSPDPAIATTYDILVLSSRTFANQPLMGARSLVRIVEEEKEVTKMVGGVQKTEKKTWKFFELSKYEWMTAAKVGEMAHQIGAGLKYLGLKPLDKMTLFASTRYFKRINCF